MTATTETRCQRRLGESGQREHGSKVVNENGKVRLDFAIEDGGQFDSDGKADGIITDPGAPGKLTVAPRQLLPDGQRR